MMAYVLGRDAERDLDAIWDYIAEENLDAADRTLNELFEAFELLAKNPRIGHKRKDLTSLPRRQARNRSRDSGWA